MSNKNFWKDKNLTKIIAIKSSPRKSNSKIQRITQVHLFSKASNSEAVMNEMLMIEAQ